VTKTHPISVVELALSVGLTVLGENYADELVAKAALVPEAEWHFLGPIQRNKVGKLAPVVSCFQGLCRMEEAASIARVHPGAHVLIQVDTTGAATRSGVAPDAVAGLLSELRTMDVVVDGLMCVAPVDARAAETCFATVAELADHHGLPVRSMGMSGDFELALHAGATLVRVGSALFGPRPPRDPR
jgi:PLP dependent protein